MVHAQQFAGYRTETGMSVHQGSQPRQKIGRQFRIGIQNEDIGRSCSSYDPIVCRRKTKISGVADQMYLRTEVSFQDR